MVLKDPYQVTVTTAATKLMDFPVNERGVVVLRPTAAVSLGTSNAVTTTTGFPLLANDVFILDSIWFKYVAARLEQRETVPIYMTAGTQTTMQVWEMLG